MAWKDTLLDASFRGVRFEVENVTRTGQRAVVVNEYPYQAGATLDDLNLRARRVKLKAIVYGDDYENQLFQLVSALEAPGVGELIHPIHGSMMVMADSWDDAHEADLVDGAALSISFIEHDVREVVFNADSAIAKTDAIADLADTARAAADDSLVRRVVDAVSLQGVLAAPLARLNALKDLMGQSKAALRTLLDAGPLRAVLSDLDPLLYPRAFVGDLRTIVDISLQGLPFGGRNVRYNTAAAAAAIVTAGSASSTNITAGSGMGDFQAVRKAFQPSGIVVVSQAAAPDAPMLADVATVQAHAQVHAALAIAECAAIVLGGEMDKPLLERADIEAVANQTRQALQQAIDAVRATPDAQGRGATDAALRALAWQVQQAGLAVINQRPRLVSRPSPVAGPVRLVAHALYGDPTRAPEIAAINRLGRKVYVERGDALKVYAA